MKSGRLHINILLFTLVCILSLAVTRAYFTDTASSQDNTFIAADVFPSLTPTVTPTVTLTPTPTLSIANNLVVNEVLYDISNDQQISGEGGSNRGEFVEIYNPTVSNVDLTNWSIEDNQGTSGAEPLSGTLLAGGYLILTGATSTEFQAIWTVPAGTIFNQADDGKIGNGLANGGDTVILKDNNGDTIDKMSWGTDTTGFTSGCTGSCPTTPAGQSLERNPDGLDTDDASDFTVTNPPTPGS